jgi:hypothetical protein
MGWGYWRIVTEYEDEDTFDQVIKVQRIRNPFTVYMDPDSTEPDASDAKWCFITRMVPRNEFDDMYPNSMALPWEEGSTGDEYKSWSTTSEVRIAEYFYIDDEMRTLVHLANGHTGYEDELAEEISRQIEANPDFVVKRREVQAKKVKWCKITAYEILEEQDWPGKWIPVVRVIGNEVDIEGKVNYFGLIRHAKDSQRMYNFWVTSETELIALAPKAPWIMEEGQIEGHEQRWKEANNKSLPYLLYKGTSINGKPAPPPQRQQFAGPPAGVVQAKIAAAQDMQAVTGIRFDATLQERMYDESGKALRELKRVGDLGNFHYVDNLSRSLRFTGMQFIDLIPKIYDTDRVITILREDDSEERVEIDPTLPVPHSRKQMPDGRIQRLYNPKLGDYEVAVTIGPSFATKRAEAADSMIMFMKAVPQAGPIIGDLIAKNMDWPGAEEISTRLQSMLPPALLNKKIDQLPPEARGLVNSLMQQMQQLKAEHDKALALLGDQEKDRQIDREGLANEREGMARDYEAKVMKIVADLEAKMAAVEQKAAQDSGKGDGMLDFIAKMEKIAADMEAKMAKIALDNEAKHMQMQMQSALAASKQNQDGEIAEKKMEGRVSQQTFKHMEKQLKELTKKLDGGGDMAIEFVRDKNGRISGAKRSRLH